MDVIDIQRAGFYGKSEEEIVEFLKRAMDELGLTLECSSGSSAHVSCPPTRGVRSGLFLRRRR